MAMTASATKREGSSRACGRAGNGHEVRTATRSDAEVTGRPLRRSQAGIVLGPVRRILPDRPKDESELEREGEVRGDLAGQPDRRNDLPFGDQSLDLGARKAGAI